MFRPSSLRLSISAWGKDRAFEWLEKAYQERSPNLINLKVHPSFDPIRSDQRFANLLRKVGLPS
jgi:hypothetical protein